ncbi:winged helix-turn-helix transcriptional regulator [Alkaliphilus pronyensis]|uniref:Winged helix-turn-helix transcriptional regulator n=1 Tax=Alkaliphilus pronyensis TaxID=1482732 RepID=A0A6I0FC69_9FIRM|nr:metalloregulator ArsR/SmtB family transcription factor [Alkaliphilus pronyensis]KAB3530666.1 winged helix-turn-helix transcriptional regulator [Alkaliphilus pronyensis]
MNYDKVFKALADKKRILILKTLNINGIKCVCDLVEEVNIPQSKLSYHLKLLLESNLITKTSEGKWNYYEINKAVLTIVLTENVIKSVFE